MASLKPLVVSWHWLVTRVSLFPSVFPLMLQKLDQLQQLPGIAVSRQHSRKTKAETLSLMKPKLHTSFLPHPVGQNKSQGQELGK